MVAARSTRRRGRAEPDPEPADHEQEEVQDEDENGHEAHDEEQDDEAAAAEDVPPGELISLQFNEELTWRPGKPIPSGTLFARLEELSRELIDMDQDTVDAESLSRVVPALGSRNLIGHKDPGIKAKTASCLVEILRLCAPDAPFTEEQIQVRPRLENRPCVLRRLTD